MALATMLHYYYFSPEVNLPRLLVGRGQSVADPVTAADEMSHDDLCSECLL